jgi:glycosyltransferase involved in cell wall biosynthesis
LNVLYAGTLPPHPGGTAIVGAQLVVGLARAGHRVRALAPITAAALRGGARFAALHPEVPVEHYLVSAFESSPNNPATEEYRRVEREQIAEGLSSLVCAEPPDAVVVGRETFALSVQGCARELGLPTVLIIQGGTTAGMLAGTLPAETRDALLRAFRQADAMVAVARHLADTYRRLGFPHVRAVQNGVDLAAFSPRPRSARLVDDLAIAPGDVVLVHASNLKDIKRPLDIVRSAGTALRHDPRLLYVVVGDGPLRTAMEEACARAGLADRFRFTGWVDHEEIPHYLNLADAVLMPSETEGLALVYLEAMACGRAVIASDIAGAAEVIEGGHTGLLHRMGDPEDLASQTLAAAADAAWRSAIGARARETALLHPVERTVAAYAEVLAEVIGTRRHTRA